MWRVFDIAIPCSQVWFAVPPQRRPDRHRGQLAVAALPRPRLAGDLVLLGQPRVERAAQGHVAGAAAGGHQHALVGPDVHGAAVVGGGDAEHPPGGRALAHDARHLVAHEDLRALRPRALLERPDESGAHAGRMMRHPLAGHRPLDGALLAAHPRRLRRPDQVVLELDAVLDQELVGGGVLVGEGAHQVPVAVAALQVVVAYPVYEHLLRRVLDPVLLLVAGAAAEVHVAA